MLLRVAVDSEEAPSEKRAVYEPVAPAADGGDDVRVRSFGAEAGEYTPPVVVAGATTTGVTGAARTPDRIGRALTVSAGVVLVLGLARMRLVVVEGAA